MSTAPSIVGVPCRQRRIGTGEAVLLELPDAEPRAPNWSGAALRAPTITTQITPGKTTGI